MPERATSTKTIDQLEPTVFVIFGGAGDLTWRKLVPALFDLSQDRSLPARFAILAVDRIKLGDERASATVARWRQSILPLRKSEGCQLLG